MPTQVTKESLSQWIAELESQPHLSLKEERWLAVCNRLNSILSIEQADSKDCPYTSMSSRYAEEHWVEGFNSLWSEIQLSGSKE